MTELVVDASAFALVVGRTQPDSLRERITTAKCHAPHLIDAEVGNVLRRHVLANLLTADVALCGLRALRYLVDHRYQQTGPLAEAAWRLRGAITFYDALYVALAATLDVPLLTADSRLARAPGLPCQVELVG